MQLSPELLALLSQGGIAGFLGYMATNAIKKWVPPARRSVVCFAVALIASVVWEMLSGKSWVEAIAVGIAGGGMFVGIHEFLTKGIQGDAKPKPAG